MNFMQAKNKNKNQFSIALMNTRTRINIGNNNKPINQRNCYKQLNDVRQIKNSTYERFGLVLKFILE